MGLAVPLTVDHAALAFNQWCTIHASADKPYEVAKAQTGRTIAVRTVCGSDVFPYIVGTERPGTQLLMSWPPPPAQRCVDCERILGRPRPIRGGWGTWDTLEERAS
jgi:hypothetical protein